MPEAISETRNTPRRQTAEQRRQGMKGRLDFGDFWMAGMESRRGHDDHGHVDHSGNRQRDDAFPVGELEQQSPVSVIARLSPVLGQAGMEIDRMRHDRGADNADGNGQRRGVGKAGRDEAERRPAPVDRRNEDLE